MRNILIIDLMVYGGLSVFGAGAMIAMFLTGQEWDIGKLIAAISAPALIIILSVGYLLKLAFSGPDYTTTHGIKVWCEEVEQAKDQKAFSDAIDFFVERFSILYAQEHDKVEPEQIKAMLKGLEVRWSSKPVSAFGFGWSIRDKSGLQSGKEIVLMWIAPEIKRSALFHELMHVYDEIVQKNKPDYKHLDSKFWAIEGKI